MSDARAHCVQICQILPGRKLEIERGESLFHQGEAIHQLYIVLAGEIILTRNNSEGDELILQRAGERQVVAEASLVSTHYHCDARATLPTTLHSVATEAVIKRLSSDASFALSWITALSSDLKAARAQTSILRLKSVRARLDGWLALHDGRLPSKGERVALAMEIGVTPEALYREIARRNRW